MIQQAYSKIAPIIEFILLFIIATHMVSFYLVSAHFAASSGVDYGALLLTSFDRAIPFTVIFFPFYMSEYLILELYMLAIITSVNFNTACSRKMCCCIVAMQAAGTVFFIAWPTSFAALMNSADSTAQPHNKVLYHFFENFNDYLLPMFNSFPSLHIAEGWLMIRFFNYFFPKSITKTVLSWILVIWFIGMALGTVTLKYHYLIDVIGGFVLAELVYRWVVVRDIFQTAQWDRWLSQKKLFFVELLCILVTGALLYIAYPDYMQIGR